ncbi:hypothetical protein [Sphingobium algorifonticola]|jgi:hypothetical protein|uniref:Uncharacterized protein n=2 Tax=Sphingobium TaxID=165695 RepID=A0A437J502_9SPHN|nr:hypothetical protein [Sphingobium algorifonticola]RVT39658.1 hypothetical protein ENE74_14990 [Sphingobium algorifonticola]
MKEQKERAFGSISDWKDARRDDIYEAEKAFALDGPLDDGLHIRLTPEHLRVSPFHRLYTPLK